MMLSFTTHTTCPECGCDIRGLKISHGVTVLPHSIRTEGSIRSDRPCPECGFGSARYVQPQTLQLDAESQCRGNACPAKLRPPRRSQPEVVHG